MKKKILTTIDHATFKDATAIWGERHRFRKLQEEASELVTAVSHFLDKRPNGVAHIHEEFAHVEICMDEIRMLLDSTALAKERKKKLIQLRKKIQSTKRSRRVKK